MSALIRMALVLAVILAAEAGSVPQSIRECETDSECETAARIECEAGNVTWCEEIRVDER
jgi:hypothetical protein